MAANYRVSLTLTPLQMLMKSIRCSREALENSIAEFSKKHDLNAELVRSVVDEYFADKQSVTKIVLRERLAEKKLPLIKQTAVINEIMAFVRDMYDKFK